MRWLLLVGVLVLGLPAAAAERAAEIRLRHLAVDELAYLLAPPEGSRLLGRPAPELGAAGLPVPPGWPARSQWGYAFAGGHLIPNGITAWTADARWNRVRVAGTEAAIREFKALIRKVDVEPAEVRLIARLLPVTDAALRELDPVLLERYETFSIGGILRDNWGLRPLTREQQAKLARLTADSTTEITATANRPLHLRLPRIDEPVPGLSPVLVQPHAGQIILRFREPSFLLRGGYGGGLGGGLGGGGLGGELAHQLVFPFYTFEMVEAGQALFVRPPGSAWAATIVPLRVLKRGLRGEGLTERAQLGIRIAEESGGPSLLMGRLGQA